MTATVAQMYPARTDDNGTTWWRAGPSREDGWTSQREYADPSYGEAPPDEQETDTMTAITETGEFAPRATEWENYPLPPELPRPTAKFNGYGWYVLPAPQTGRPSGFPRATKIADTLDDQAGLEKWKRRETVKRVLWLLTTDHATPVKGKYTVGSLIRLMTDALQSDKVTDLDKVLNLIDNLLGGSEARELGEAVHAWLAALDVGQVLYRDLPELVRPHADAYLSILSRFGLVPVPEYVERVVLNDQGEETVAGQIDRVYRIITTGELVLGDVKTSKDLEYGWLPFGVQVGGCYGWATKILSLDGKAWEPMPELRRDFAVLMHLPSDQPERSQAITIDLMWGAETMIASLDARRRRKEAKREVPKHAIPSPSDTALRYAAARVALTRIETAAEGQALYETYEDVWDDALGEFAESIAELL